jgi:hypothetical protein
VRGSHASSMRTTSGVAISSTSEQSPSHCDGVSNSLSSRRCCHQCGQRSDHQTGSWRLGFGAGLRFGPRSSHGRIKVSHAISHPAARSSQRLTALVTPHAGCAQTFEDCDHLLLHLPRASHQRGRLKLRVGTEQGRASLSHLSKSLLPAVWTVWWCVLEYGPYEQLVPHEPLHRLHQQ